MASTSSFGFWFRWIMVMVAVMAGAIAFLVFFPSLGQSMQASNLHSTQKDNIADSVNRFYAKFRAVSRDPIKDQYGDYTIMLDQKSQAPVGKRIEAVTSKQYDPMQNWQGELKQRSFPVNSTLKQEAVAHAAKEGVSLMWDLSQDFTIRHRFNSNNTFAGMLEELAGAIDSNFDQPISIYFCEKKRVYLITLNESAYVSANCIRTHGLAQSY